MYSLKFILIFVSIVFYLHVEACTIVAVSGRATADGRPLLLKNRDSNTWDIKIRIEQGVKYKYLSQCKVANGSAYSGYNETGFSIINSHSFNMPNKDYSWNARIMQMALESCASVDEFEFLLDTLAKPLSVCSNYGVMDAQGNVSIFEVNAYTHVRYNADDTRCGYMIRTNYSFSQDTTGVSIVSPTSHPRYMIASSYLDNAFASVGYISKEKLLGLSRCLMNSGGKDLRDLAPFGENEYTPVDFRYYVPRYETTSVMLIEGVKPVEDSNLTVAWTAIGPPFTTVTLPYLISSQHFLPQITQKGVDGHAWLCYQGQMLKNGCFVNSTNLDLAKLYNMSGTGVMQRIMEIENVVLHRGTELVGKLRVGEASDCDLEQYYTWVDDYVKEQYGLMENNNTVSIKKVEVQKDRQEVMAYYDILGRRVMNIRPDAVIKKRGSYRIVLN